MLPQRGVQRTLVSESGARFSDTEILPTLEKSLYFSEFGDQAEFLSRLNISWSCIKGKINKGNSGAKRPELPTAQQINEPQQLLSPRLFFCCRGTKHECTLPGAETSNNLLQYLGKVLGHPFVVINKGWSHLKKISIPC